jgi:hypothetical protein
MSNPTYEELLNKNIELEQQINTQTTAQSNNKNMMASLTKFLPSISKVMIESNPQYQKDQQNQKLLEKYNQAKNTFETAPTNLTQAKREYIESSEGIVGYNALRGSEAIDEADKIAKQYTEQFNDNIVLITTLNSAYKSLSNNYTINNRLLNKLIDENEDMQKLLDSYKSDILTSDRKTFYEDQGSDMLSNWYKFFITLYILSAVILTMSLFLAANTFTIGKKIGIVLIIIIYPFIIYYIIEILLIIMRSIYDLLPKNVYVSI